MHNFKSWRVMFLPGNLMIQNSTFVLDFELETWYVCDN